MSSAEDRVAAESSACSGVNSAENPAPTSCPPKKNACDDVEDVFLSIGPSTPSGDDYLAEKRHLQDLARYLDAFTVAEHSTAAAAVRPHQTPGDASTVEEWLEGSSRKALSWRPTAVPCTPQEAAARDDAVATPSTVRAIDDSAVKREDSAATVLVTPLSSLPGTSQSSLNEDTVTFTPVTAPALGTHGIVPQIQNVVATVNLCCQLDLRDIALRAHNAEYNPEHCIAAVIMRIREPRTTALLFRSGKIVCTGARSELQARIAARKFARITQKLGYNARFTDFKVQNIVASCDVGFRIKLESLALIESQFSCYEPELFPGLVYRMEQPSVLLLVFVSGKVVLTGAKVKEHIYQAFDKIYPKLQNHRKV